MVRHQGFFDDLMSVGLKLPWKVGVAAAVVIFVLLHVVAVYTQAPVGAKSLADMGAVVQRGYIHVFAEFLQYIIPAGLLIGATVGYFNQRQLNSVADPGVAVAGESNPTCPQCRTAMIQRTAKKGQFAGEPFWGCGRYPKCKGILKIS
jgi:Topoisomerase DNA binding C4 zinc finger